MPRPMPPHTLMVGSHLMAAATAILALLPLAVAPFQTPGRRAKLYLSVASFFLFLQCFLGPARRRSSSSLVRYGSWVAFHAPFYLATYAAGNLWLLSSHEELDILAWGIVLFQALHPMPPMLAYYRGDYDHMWKKMNSVKSLGFMGTIFHTVYVTKTCTVMSFVLLLAYVLFVTSVSRVILPLHMSSLNNNHALAAVSDEEDSAKLNKDHAVAPVDIAVEEELAKLHVVDPADVSNEENSAKSKKEYLVLSYKLFLMMMNQLDRREWLPSDAAAIAKFQTQIDIAFQVVEVQLAFLYAQCFTSNHTNNMTAIHDMLDSTASTYVSLAAPFVSALIKGLTLTLYSRSGLVLTALVLVLDCLRGPVRFARLWTSDWGKALLAQRETQGKPGHPSFIDHLCNVISCFPVFNFTGKHYWQEMIGQYSLLLDYNRGYRWKAVVAQAVALAQSTWLPDMRKTHHPREEEAASLPQDLKTKLGYSLGKAQRQRTGMTSGSRALSYHKVPGHVWISTLQEKNHANTILIWYIATCYLDMDKDYDHCTCRPERSTCQAYISYDIATKLSRYCAYLVAFLPELLPGEAQATSEAFQSVVKKTRTALGDALSEEDKYKKMETLSDVTEDNSFQVGVALAKQLQGIFPAKKIDGQRNSEKIAALWNVMADFWVETLLYIAPCNSTTKHIDMLAQGGELITHVWALLYNTRMMVRVPVKILVSQNPEEFEIINPH